MFKNLEQNTFSASVLTFISIFLFRNHLWHTYTESAYHRRICRRLCFDSLTTWPTSVVIKLCAAGEPSAVPPFKLQPSQSRVNYKMLTITANKNTSVPWPKVCCVKCASVWKEFENHWSTSVTEAIGLSPKLE